MNKLNPSIVFTCVGVHTVESIY